MKNLIAAPKKYVLFGSLLILTLFMYVMGGQMVLSFSMLMAGRAEGLIILSIALVPLSLVFMNRAFPGSGVPLPIAVLQLGFLFVYGIALIDTIFASNTPVPLLICLAVWFGILVLLALGRYFYTLAKLPKRTQIKYAIGFMVVLLVPVIYFAIANIDPNSKFDKVSGMIQSLADDKLKAAGATELKQKAVYRKDGFLSRDDCGFDNSCPSVHREWLVLMDNSYAARQAFIESMLKSQGYEYKMLGMHEYDFNAVGIKDGVGLTIAAKVPDGVSAPYPAPAKKVWQTVSISSGGSADGPWMASTKTELDMTPYTSKYKEYSFAYPKGWKLDDRSTPQKDEIVITSVDGKLGRQPSPEPKADSGQVLRIIVTPCPGGKECSLDGVYVYPYDSSIRQPEVQLDDGTKAAVFSFQYLNEEGTDYTVFFRNGKKYVITYNVAGKGRGEISNGHNAVVIDGLRDSFRFAD